MAVASGHEPHPLRCNPPVHRSDRMSNWQHVMRHRCTSTGKSLGQSSTVTRRSATVLLPVDDQRRYPVQAGWQIMADRRERAKQDSARQELGRVRSRAAAMMAPLEKPMAIGALVRP